jgi:hypothetical protein
MTQEDKPSALAVPTTKSESSIPSVPEIQDSIRIEFVFFR